MVFSETKDDRDNPDARLAAMAPVGGRAARDISTGPLPGVRDPDLGGQFNNKNAGKRGISLNIRHPKGLQIAKDMVRTCDVVAEGFSPGVLQRLGLGHEVMESIRPHTRVNNATEGELEHSISPGLRSSSAFSIRSLWTERPLSVRCLSRGG